MLKQFDDYLVKILIAAAVIDLLIALTGGDYSVGCTDPPPPLMLGTEYLLRPSGPCAVGSRRSTHQGV